VILGPAFFGKSPKTVTGWHRPSEQSGVETPNIADLIKCLKDRAAERQLTWFRGQANYEWKLVPSLGRAGQTIQAEMALISTMASGATTGGSMRSASMRRRHGGTG